MINEHDMTRKMLNLIREATNGLDPIENQVPVPQNSLTPKPEEEGPQGNIQQTSSEDNIKQVSSDEINDGPVNNIAIIGKLPSNIEFTMNYNEDAGVYINIKEQIQLNQDIIDDLAKLIALQKPFRDKWNERGANSNLGKKQIIIFKSIPVKDENGNLGNKSEFGPDSAKSWFDEDKQLFNPVSDQIKFTSYIINP